ncbi:MAG: HD domain-containing protein [Bacillota bacterium]
MDREEALKLVGEKVSNENLRKHMLAVEFVMRGLAGRFDTDEEKWGLAGLLHDLDYDLTYDKPDQHGILSSQWLEEMGMDPEIAYAVKAHGKHQFERKSLMDKALYAADPVTGLVVAAALIHPEKRLASLTPDFVINRFHEKSFAKGANREQIRTAEELGLSLEEFIGIALKAMQERSGELGL